MLIWKGHLDEGMAKRFLISLWVVLLAMVAASNLWWTPSGTRGIILGGIAAAINAIGVLRDTKRMVRLRSRLIYFVGMVSRLIALILLIGVIYFKFPGKFDLIGVFLGVSVVPIAFYILVLQMKLIKPKE